MRPLIRLIIGLAGCGVLLVLLAGCGAVTGATTPTSDNGSVGTTAQAGAQQIIVTAKDNVFAPTDYRAEAGKPLTLLLTNSGANIHEVEVTGLAAETQLSPGQSKTVVLANVAAGTYEIYCELHKDQGMKGQLVVK